MDANTLSLAEPGRRASKTWNGSEFLAFVLKQKGKREELLVAVDDVDDTRAQNGSVWRSWVSLLR